MFGDAIEIQRLTAEIERLRAELTAARDALHNDFEPDNQSRAWHRANNALEQQAQRCPKCGHECRSDGWCPDCELARL